MPACLVTKAVASGMLLIMTAVWLLGLAPFDRHTALVGNGVALALLAITTVLLVADLERPERLLRILTRPQWKSWYTRGAFILISFSLVCTLWFALELGAQQGWLPEGVAVSARIPLMALGLPLALLTAIYTAFHFQQREGRDLWRSKLMPWHMAVQAVMAGAAVGAALAGLTGSVTELVIVAITFLVASVADLLLRITEVNHAHTTSHGRNAAWLVRHGGLPTIWKASVALGAIAGVAMLALSVGILTWLTGVLIVAADGSDEIFSDTISSRLSMMIATLISIAPWVTTTAAFLSLIGLFLYNTAIFSSGQDVPNA